MELLHVWAGLLLVALNAAAGVWGVWRYARATGPSRSFDHVLALAQTSVFVAGLIGVALLAGDGRPDDPLHERVYGPFMVIAILAAWGFRRPEHPRTNTLVFAIAALAVAALGVRALYTG